MKLNLHFFLIFLLTVFGFIHTANAVQSPNTVNTIFSILSYVKWNSPTPVICIIDNPALAKQFTINISTYNKYKAKNVSVQELKKSQCNIVIFSTFSANEEQLILNTSVTFPALSISTNNTQCEVGSAFCLYKKNNQILFRVNLESVNQTKVHIDPRVLLLAKEPE